jgi:hypothetical protein
MKTMMKTDDLPAGRRPASTRRSTSRQTTLDGTTSNKANKRTDKGAAGVSTRNWNPSWEAEMELIGRQHQALFDQIHILLDRSKRGRVRETLNFMASYGMEHIRTEEGLQQKTGYPRAEEHFVTHRN